MPCQQQHEEQAYIAFELFLPPGEGLSLSLFNLRVADDSRVYGDKGVYQDLLQGVADHGCKIGGVG